MMKDGNQKSFQSKKTEYQAMCDMVMAHVNLILTKGNELPCFMNRQALDKSIQYVRYLQREGLIEEYFNRIVRGAL